MTEYDDVVLMATHLVSGSIEERGIIIQKIRRSDPEQLVNILEVSREVAFDNTGDEKLFEATNFLIRYIQMDMALRVFD